MQPLHFNHIPMTEMHLGSQSRMRGLWDKNGAMLPPLMDCQGTPPIAASSTALRQSCTPEAMHSPLVQILDVSEPSKHENEAMQAQVTQGTTYFDCVKLSLLGKRLYTLCKRIDVQLRFHLKAAAEL